MVIILLIINRLCGKYDAHLFSCFIWTIIFSISDFKIMPVFFLNHYRFKLHKSCFKIFTYKNKYEKLNE